jgi:hypothetical protein
VLMVGVAHAAINKFYRAGECYKIEYRKYQKIESHKAFAITRFYERSRRWSQACGVGWAPTEKGAIERVLAECRIGATKEGNGAMRIPKPNCQIYDSQ